MDDQKIKALRDLIHSAQNSIASAKKILNSLAGENDENTLSTDGLQSYQE
jgi:hypothetical protein